MLHPGGASAVGFSDDPRGVGLDVPPGTARTVGAEGAGSDARRGRDEGGAAEGAAGGSWVEAAGDTVTGAAGDADAASSLRVAATGGLGAEPPVIDELPGGCAAVAAGAADAAAGAVGLRTAARTTAPATTRTAPAAAAVRSGERASLAEPTAVMAPSSREPV